MDNPKINQDERFSKFISDPRFQKFAANRKKIKIEKRFQSMFNDEKFKTNYTVDKYGKKIKKTSTEELKRFYEIGSEDSDQENSEPGSEDEREEQRQEELAISNELELKQEEFGDDVKSKLRHPNVDYARGEARLFSDSSSDEEFESDVEDEEEEEVDHNWGEVGNDAGTTEEATRRLAICNMDWDRIRASDIMVLCSSFVPTGGSIRSVRIFPSEFGKQRLKEEEEFGPQELKKVEDEKVNSEDEQNGYIDDEDDDVNMENLRKYQLKRLKYFYGVIECDSVETADNIYKECDGIEYESTANKVDLRFIPDDMNFDENEIKDICTELPNLDKYQPRTYTTTALQQAKVELTWDEGSIERKEFGSKISSGKIDEVSEQEMKKFVAFSSEEEDVNEEKVDDKAAISKYTSLLEEINQEEEKKNTEKFEREYTWGIGVADSKSKKKEKKDMTPMEQIMEKRKERRKLKKEARMQKKEDESSEEDDIPDGIDMNDDYFAEEFANGEFEKPKTKKAKKEKMKRKREEEITESNELSLLLDDDEDDNRNHFSLSKIQKAENKSGKKSKKNKNKEMSDGKDIDDFEINLDDSRFNALYTSQHFNIDPSDPKYKKTKGMEKIIHKKIQKNIKE